MVYSVTFPSLPSIIGEHGKLGHGSNTTFKTPKLIASLFGVIVRQVSCGNRHSAAVTSDGSLYTWGDGEHGRLGMYMCTVYNYYYV